MNKSHALVYIVYGDDLTYYNGAKFSILSFFSKVPENERPALYILTEKPEFFIGFSEHVFKIEADQKQDWTCQGKYHFRIKNRGLRYLIDKAKPEISKFLFLDADTYFKKSPQPLFSRISKEQSVLFYPEEVISEVSEKSDYYILLNKTLPLKSGGEYKVSTSSQMWASAVIGISKEQLSSLDYADELIISMMESNCKAHTMEQFALSEALRKSSSLTAGDDLVSHYSTSGRKNWAMKVLKDFFEANNGRPFEDQVVASRNISFRRPFSEVIKGHIYKKKKKLQAFFKHNI